MSEPRLLPLLDAPPTERRDAARNREALMCAAAELVALHGAHAVTMDAVAARAGVGKGTVFRRFESREGLMGALIDQTETDWQASVISGPPPLGPGAGPARPAAGLRPLADRDHAPPRRPAPRGRLDQPAVVRGVLLHRDARALPARRARRHR